MFTFLSYHQGICFGQQFESRCREGKNSSVPVFRLKGIRVKRLNISWHIKKKALRLLNLRFEFLETDPLDALPPQGPKRPTRTLLNRS